MSADASVGDERDGWAIEFWTVQDEDTRYAQYQPQSFETFVDLGEASRKFLKIFEDCVSRDYSDCSETEDDEPEGTATARSELKYRKKKDMIESWNGIGPIEFEGECYIPLNEPVWKVEAYPVTVKAVLKWKVIRPGHRLPTKAASKLG